MSDNGSTQEGQVHPMLRLVRPAWIFDAYYVALYSPSAVWISFFPLWRRDRGLTEAEVGLCLSAGSIAAVLVSPIVGSIADRSGRRKELLLILIAASAIGSLLNFAAEGFAMLVAAYLATRLFTASLIPLSESIVLANLERFRLDFGRVRSFGSAAVVVLSMVLGLLVDRVGIGAVIVVLTGAYVVQGLLGSLLPVRPTIQEHAPSAPIAEVLRVPGFPLLVGSAAISQACHGVFYAYSTFYWLSSGLSATTIGALWALGVTAEIVAFSFGGRIVMRLSPAAVIAIGSAAGVARWGLLGSSGALPTAIAVQLLQAATLGLSQVGAAYYISSAVPPRVLSSGTGLYSACIGLMSAVFIAVGGQIYPRIGGGIFLLTSGLCLIGLASAAALVIRTRRTAGATRNPA